MRFASFFLLPASLFLLLFFFYPLASIFRVSFARAGGNILAPFATLASASNVRVIGFTFYQAALSTLLTLALGLPGAYLFARYRFRGQNLLRALTAVPFVLPTLVVAAAFNALLGPRGWVKLALDSLHLPPVQFLHTLGAILLAHVFYNTTIVLRLVGDFWSRLDPRLPAAARMLGASRLRALREITLPLLAPAIASAALLVFLFDFTSFGVILVLGGPRFSTLEVEIYRQTISLFDLPLAAVLSLAQLLCTLGILAVYNRLSSHLSVPLTLRPLRVTRRSLRTFRQRLVAGTLIAVLSVLLLAPLAALAVRSVTSEHGFTLAYYRELTINRRNSLFYVPPIEAIGNSLTIAGATVLLSLALGLPAAWALTQSPRHPVTLSPRHTLPPPPREATLPSLFNTLLLLPLGASAVTLGLGFIVALDRPPLDLRASPLLLPLAHTLVAFPFVVRSLVPALRSIKPRLRQAAAVLGASPWQVWREIDLPLVGRAVLVASTFAFCISLGEFGATSILARPGRPTVPVAIFRFLGLPGALNYGQALALSAILMFVCAAGILFIERLRIAEVGEF